MKKTLICIFIFSILNTAIAAQAENTELRIFELKRAEAQAIYSVVEHLISKDGKMSVDQNANSLIVIDYPANLEQIASVIEKLDVAQKQIEIKVRIVEATNSFLNKAGISSGQVIMPPARFSAVLDLLETSDEAKVRTDMTVRTLSNQPAAIQATVEEIFGYAVTRHGRHRETINPITREAGSVLEVLPRANNDGTILVSLQPSSSAFEEDGDISAKSILTQVVINDGDTIAIGGVDVEKSEQNRGILPGTGITISRGRGKESQKVTMFLTAKVLK